MKDPAGVQTWTIYSDHVNPPRSNPFPYRCPVCEGRGIVAMGFYMATGATWGVGTIFGPEQCRSCGGGGIVWG